ncbi:YqiA/YcfP family alpha/beta fold hydrolase [Psychromonas sp. CD1]|uniref:YqiA/YcfP family alpha/beta fold hydrolase n=1 Tax=Psychromonas sp. CD1 TaxID=1979839 RepID=UPI000B9ACA57|nr:YqiA/YcfP family alpha/beta fold hydrolase [Psychromonas sp. CD1]
MRKILIALHGFHSSPKSLKVQQMQAYIHQNHADIVFVCPQLPCLPQQVWHLLCALITQYKNAQIGLMGSSLGGYFAMKLAHEYALKTILINPVVKNNIFHAHMGQQRHPCTGEAYNIDKHYIHQLKALEVKMLSMPKNIWLLQQEGDEVLDHRYAKVKYSSCKTTSEKGGDHSFIGFERFIPDIVEFLFPR